MFDLRIAPAMVALIATLLFTVLTGCDAGVESRTVQAAPATASAPASPAADDPHSDLLPLPEPADENAVGVRIHEYEIDLTRDTVAAGPLRFHVLNAGTTAHMFIVRDDDSYSATPHLVPGDSSTLEVVLEPGEYNVLCAVRDEFDHISEGERRSFVVL